MRSRLAKQLVITGIVVGSLLVDSRASAEEPVSKIAFGSCVRQDNPQPIWNAIVAERPGVFLFIGDNIYGDTEDMAVMREKYDTLAADPGYQALKQTCPILATWDDHDYGRNDAGAEYPAKTESQQAFLDFFDEPADSERRGTPGVYDAKVFGPTGKRVQIILLDTRYFRSELTKAPRGPEGDGRLGSYVPNNDPDTTILGAAQWTWLSEQLRQPAEIRVIVSSIQVVAEDHRFEKWMNHPHERERLYKLIGQTKARGVLFISGDRHMAELSRMDGGVGYPLYDLTSSALNQTSDWYNEINRHRWSRAYSEPNYGLITIDWSQADPTITLEIRKVDGKPAIWHQIALSGSNRDR